MTADLAPCVRLRAVAGDELPGNLLNRRRQKLYFTLYIYIYIVIVIFRALRPFRCPRTTSETTEAVIVFWAAPRFEPVSLDSDFRGRLLNH